MDSTSHLQAEPGATAVPAAPAGPVLTRSEERLVVTTRTVPASRVRVRRRAVTEQRSVQVTVSREELVLEHFPAGPEPVGAPGLPAAPPHTPIVIVLHEQVPQVVLRTQPYEQVRVSVVAVPGQQQVSAAVRKEVVSADLRPAGQPGRPARPAR